ncbi:GGDEF domain-containing protein [Halomonas sp. CH40]
MKLYFNRALGCQIVLGFTLLGGICALAAMLYIFQARQHLGANYTALAAQVVRPQSHAVLLRHTLYALRERPQDHILNERLNNLLWRIPKHIDVVGSSLRASQLKIEDYAPSVNRLNDVKNALLELRQVSQPNSDVSHRERLALGFMIENDLAKAYSELSDLVHSKAGEQRIIMERLALTIALLVFVILLLVVGLSLALRKLNREHQKITQLSQVDELTGLGNRRYLLNFTDSLCQQSQRSGRPLSLVLLDIDHFKQVNDTFGHPAGDRVLQMFARALKDEIRAADVLARMGGEEFCLLMPDTDADGACELAERIRMEVASLTQQQLGIPTSITVSLGVATAWQSDLDFKHLYARADQALYQAKTKGRNRVETG